MSQQKKKNSSWQKSAKWYEGIVGSEGHYYHRQVIFPNLLKRIDFTDAHVLDLACGQGILSRQIPEATPYLGIDLASALISSAKKQSTSKGRQFFVSDITKPLKLEPISTHAFIILALQNTLNPLGALQNAFEGLKRGGKLYIVLNHPCFRIPRHSSWVIDDNKKSQERKISSYMSSMEIPISTNPGKGKSSEKTISHHFSMQSLFQWLSEAGFVVTGLEEWCSDKKSTGSKAKMEDRARTEFPLFMMVEAQKHSQGTLPTIKSQASKMPKESQSSPKGKNFRGKR